MYKTILSLFVLSLFLPTVSDAHFDQKGAMYENCYHFINPEDVAFTKAARAKATECEVYIKGYIDAYQIFGDTNDKHMFCLPKNSSRKYLASLFVKFLDNHPEYLHIQASVSLSAALREAYMCK